MDYSTFLQTKRATVRAEGIEIGLDALHESLFPFQMQIVQWALHKGRVAIFADCGLGKTFMQLEWGRQVHAHTGGDVLILAPLAVAAQTVAEGKKLGITVHLCRSQSDVQTGINITNYEMLQHFDASHFAGVVLDESSILKSYMGKTKRALVEAFASTPYRLACTATPAPNDVMEIGNHSEFLGVMPSPEMLMRWFINDTMKSGHYRLKGHAEKDFWQWVASWAISIRKPSDLGYSDDGFALPELQITRRYVDVDVTQGVNEGELFRAPTMSATNLHKEMRLTAEDRAQAVADIILKDWEICGKKNTQTIDELRNKQTQNIKPSETSKAMARIEKSDWSTSGNIRQNTKIESWNCDGSMQQNEIPSVESGMLRTQNIEKENAQRSGHSTQPTLQKNSTDDSPTAMESASKNTSNFLQSKTENAQSAANLNLERINTEQYDSLSITAIKQAPFGDCSAQVAISALASSKMTLTSCDELLTTSPQKQTLEPWVIWCNTNYEQEELDKRFGDLAFSVYGSLSSTEKERRILGWLNGERPVLISKPSICGYGLNFQHCHKTAFVGLSYSFEDFYQATRRLYRFGQRQPVEVVIVAAHTESPLVASLERKIYAHLQMSESMNASVSKLAVREELKLMRHEDFTSEQGRDWTLYHGDCVTVARSLPDESMHFSIFSPPFSSLYIYSDAIEDMGNSANDDEFFRHFDFLIPELLRITKPGRLCAVHCKDLVNYKGRDGAAGIRDFSGDIIRHFTSAGWAYHSKVVIWKDPVVEMQRTKANGLLYKTLRADSSFSRQGMPEYLLIFRKWPQDEAEETHIEPVTHTKDTFPLEMWQRYASPVWFDIRQTNVLNVEQARESQDEKHICPLQLDVIERAVQLWTNPGDVVFSPFAGIGSEGYQSLSLGRKFVGVELKRSYFEVARKNLERIVREKSQVTLFDFDEVTA